ncbi:MAG: hypothetical protein V3T72_08830 [Thermoanaerobaculia bacterium]
MTRILQFVLDHHRGAGGHALLLSATLGAAARAHLLAENDLDRRQDRVPSLAAALATPYPALSHKPADGPLEVREISGNQAEKSVAVTLGPWIAAAETVAGKALAAARDGAKVLVIRNTVKDCAATQEAVEALAGDDPVLFRCREVAAPHHGRFADLDRKALDRSIEALFGKERPPGGRLAVATQTVEQSLDLDADLLITDLCPMDVLLQRIGRLHRHPRRDRPESFAQARVIVLVPAEGDLERWVSGERLESTHGLRSVYQDLRILEATWRLLRPEPTLRIPAENRRLVEDCVHPERLAALTAELGDAWEAHQRKVLGSLIADTQQANLNTVDRDAAFGEGVKYLFVPRGERKIPTRLGLGDRLVRFKEPFETPFGNSVAELTIPEFLVADVPKDTEVAEDVRRDAQGIRFRFGPNAYRYDRMGLRLLT